MKGDSASRFSNPTVVIDRHPGIDAVEPGRIKGVSVMEGRDGR